MKLLPLAFAGALVLTAGLARAQEPKAHEHEHGQPPAVAEQKADDTGHKEMCACCADKDKMAAMKKEMMKEMMKDAEKDKK